jgi:hypothetical protein
MRKHKSIARLMVGVSIVTIAITAAAGSKTEGITMLKDFQPTGMTDKTHKNQQYDLSFAASGRQYTCRTNEKESLKATDFIVGSEVKYEIGGNKGKLKSSSGKQVECTVVRVADLPAAAQP